MVDSLFALGQLVRQHREHKDLSQEVLASRVSPHTNRSAIAHLEQGLRIPTPETLGAICTFLQIPGEQWEHFAEPDSEIVFAFEAILGELIGRPVNSAHLDIRAREIAFKRVARLFQENHTESQTRSALNALLVLYDIHPKISEEFFERYFFIDGVSGFRSIESFENSVRKFQTESIRIFNSFVSAYETLNTCERLDDVLSVLRPKPIHHYSERDEWSEIQQMPMSDLSVLGYISSAQSIRKEKKERNEFAKFLKDLAASIQIKGKAALDDVSEKTKRQMDRYRRKFDSKLEHGFLSPLFVPDFDQLVRAAEEASPPDESSIDKIERVQDIGLKNLSCYLAADHLDVYVATSMRSDAHFASISQFTRELFSHRDVRNLKLRYFDPTQSWIGDRVAKGLVEALMLRRAEYTIYMAQKSDSFGKDSEASVALGQGKSVIVYVPKLVIPELSIDSETLTSLSKNDLKALLGSCIKNEEIGDEEDSSDLISRYLTVQLENAPASILNSVAKNHWADFELYDEAQRIEVRGDLGLENQLRKNFRTWLDEIIKNNSEEPISEELKSHFIKMIVALTNRAEERAAIFRDMHPLALQIIIRSGVLNGMLVVRSVQQCANLLSKLVTNELDLDLQSDEYNYRLIETSSRSTIRVISRHRLIGSAFATYYAQTPLESKTKN